VETTAKRQAPHPADGDGRGTDGRAHTFVRACLFAILLTPLLVVPGIANPFVTTRTVVFRVLVELGLVGLVWLLASRDTRSDLRREPFLWAFVAFVLVAALSAALSPAPYRSLFGDIERVWGVWGWFHFLLFYLLLRTFLDAAAWRRLLGLSVLVSVCSAAYMALQLVGGPVELPVFGAGRDRLYGTMGNPAYMAAFAFVALGLALFLAFEADDRWARRAYAAAAVVQLPVLALAGTISSGIAVVGGVVVGLTLALRSWRSRGVLIAGTVVAAVLFVLSLRSVPDGWVDAVPLLRRLAATDFSSSNIVLRLMAWGAAWEGFLDRPLLGWGMDNFKLVWDAHFPPEYYTVRAGLTLWDRAHSAYMEVLSTLGVPGILAFLAMGGLLLRSVLAAFRAKRLGRAQAIVLASVITGYALYLVAWFEDYSSLMLFLVLCAFVTHRAAGGPILAFGERRSRRTTAWAMTAGVAVLVAASTYLHGVVRLRAAAALHRAEEPRAVELALEDFRRALHPALPDRTRAIAELTGFLNDLAEEGLDAVRADPYRRRVLDAAIASSLVRIEHELERDPRSSMLHLQHGNLLVLATRFYGTRAAYDEAVDAFRRAVALSPGRIRHRHLLASTYLMGGRIDAAFRELHAALDVYDGFGETYVFLARAHLARHDVDPAAIALRRSLDREYAAFGPGTFVVVADSLVARGRTAEAARLLRDWLELRYEVFSEWQPGQTEERYHWETQELRLAARLPLLLARSGRTDEARTTALALAAHAPWAAAEAGAFLRVLDAGEDLGPYGDALVSDEAVEQRPVPEPDRP